ncbi:MAG: glycosyltransferase [archaeon]
MNGQAKPLVVMLIPAFNEENKIERAIGNIALKQRFELKEFDVKIAVVNDGSTDRTREAALRANAEVLTLPKNMGKAYAAMYGIKHFSKLKPSAILLCDADVWSIKGKVVKKMITESLAYAAPAMVQAVQREDNQPTFMRDYAGFRCFNSAAIAKLASLNYHHFRRERRHSTPGFGLEEFFRQYMNSLRESTVINLTQKDGFFQTSSPWRSNQDNYRLQHEEIPRAKAKMERILGRIRRTPHH